MGFVKIRQRKPIGRIWPPLLLICPFLVVLQLREVLRLAQEVVLLRRAGL